MPQPQQAAKTVHPLPTSTTTTHHIIEKTTKITWNIPPLRKTSPSTSPPSVSPRNTNNININDTNNVKYEVGKSHSTTESNNFLPINSLPEENNHNNTNDIDSTITNITTSASKIPHTTTSPITVSSQQQHYQQHQQQVPYQLYVQSPLTTPSPPPSGAMYSSNPFGEGMIIHHPSMISPSPTSPFFIPHQQPQQHLPAEPFPPPAFVPVHTPDLDQLSNELRHILNISSPTKVS